MIGKTISHYKILGKLGQGGMGVVYKAEDTVLRRTVALKFFQRDFVTDSEARSRLVREAQAASVLDHPNICTVHEIHEGEEGELFICMGYCEGETARERLRSSPRSTVEDIDIVIQIAEGLAHAHEKGIVHRDIKPENIIIGGDGRARITDFGLAKLIGRSTILKTGAVAGTISYMSPEQVRGDEVDQRSDVWSLGVILYEFLTGRLPFESEYEAAALYSILSEDVEPPSRINSGISEELEGAVLKALEKDPKDRYQSMAEMMEELRACRGSLLGETEARSPAKRTRHVWRVSRRMRVVVAVAGVAALISALALINFFGAEAARVSIAVMEFENSTGEENLDGLLSELLLVDLAQSPTVKILTREQMQNMREKMGIEGSGLSTGLELARLAGMQALVLGTAMRVGETLRLNANVYDVETGELWFAKHAQVEGSDKVFDLIDDLSRSIRKGMKVLPRWTIGGEPSLSELTTENVEAFRLYSMGSALRDSLYSRGVGMEHEEYHKAAAYLEQAVALDPDFIEGHIELALVYNHQLGDRAKALEHARKAKELSESRTAKEYLKAAIYEPWMDGDWDEAIKLIRLYLDVQPNDIRTQRHLGWLLARRQETWDEAITQLKKVIEMDPSNASGETGHAYKHLGHVYMFLGEFDEAIAAFRSYESLSLDPSGPANSLGDAYRLSGRYKEAAEQYSKVIENNPEYHLSYRGLAETYLSMGKWRDAVETYRRVLALAPRSDLAQGYVFLAEVYFKQGDFVLAEREANEALALDPELGSAHWLKGMIALEGEGDVVGARAELDSLREDLRDPDAAEESALFNHLSGWIHMTEGDSTRALEYLREAVGKAARHERAYFSGELVRGYVQTGHPEEAIREGEPLLESNPNNGEVLSLLGLAYERKGDRENMVAFLERALQTWREADRDFRPLKEIQNKL